MTAPEVSDVETVDDTIVGPPAPSPWLDVWKRFRANRLAVVGMVFLIFLILVAIFAPLIAPYGITERSSVFRGGPSSEHYFGTDIIGRDVFSRLVYGSRVSLKIGIAATTIACWASV